MSLPMMPPSLILVDAIICSTIVDVQIFKSFVFVQWVLWETEKFSKILPSPNVGSTWHLLTNSTHVTREKQYFSFLKHPFRQIFMNNIKSIDNDYTATATAVIAITTAITTSLAAMTASSNRPE